MLFIPKSKKFKKSQKGSLQNRITKTSPFFQLKGCVGLRAAASGRLTSKQLVSIKKIINKIIKKSGRLIMNLFPHLPVSKKPKEIRMGKGKGNVDRWVSKILAGSLLCEVHTISPSLALAALKAAQIRLPLKTRVVTNV
jgi:large subunit ribosomal protein L16